MEDPAGDFPLEEPIVILVGLAREGNAKALAALLGLARHRGERISPADLERLAGLDLPGSGPLRQAVRREMARRGNWRRFRVREVASVWGRGAGWVAGIMALAVALLAAVFGGIIGLRWLLSRLGF